jgi:hypothetical protein
LLKTRERKPHSYDNNSRTGPDHASVVNDNGGRSGKKTGFIQRQRTVTGAGFAQTLVLGYMANPDATREELHQTAAGAGMALSTQGLDKRFTPKGAYFLESLLAEAVTQMVAVIPQAQGLLARFKGVYIADCSQVALPEALAGLFRGSNGAQDAAVKVAVQIEMNSGQLGLWWHDGVVHDQRTGVSAHSLPPGTVRLNDLGFFNLTTFAEDERNQVYYFSRYKVGTLVYTADGVPLDLVKYLKHQGQSGCDLVVQLGADRLPCRLLASPVPPEQVGKRRKRLTETAKRKQQAVSARALALAAWTIDVTNIPREQLSLREAAILGGTRWQIECLFKLWKSSGGLAASRSQDPHRVLCEFYAKLLAVLMAHWLLVVSCWQRLDRSLHRATQVLRKQAFALLMVWTELPRLTRVLEQTAAIIQATCGMSKRRTHPLTFQRWLDVEIADG